MHKHSESCLKILDKSLPLFADKGYDGVSMRDIARAVGVKAPALYNHFPDKQTLYLAVVSHAFENKLAPMTNALTSSETADNRLKEFIKVMVGSMAADQSFRQIMQREMLDGDEQRLKFIGETMFSELFEIAAELFKEINPKCKQPHLLPITVIGMIRQHFDFQPLIRYLPGMENTTIDEVELSEHIYSLLMTGLKGNL
jgi:AcrR family transcriptional regulator